MKKTIAAILCSILVFAFAGSALAGAVNKVVPLSGTTTLETSTTRSPTSFSAMIYSNSDFGTNPTSAGVNIRVYRSTSRYTNDMTFKVSDIAGGGGQTLKTKDYLYPTTTGTFTAKSNLNSSATQSITFAGFLYF